MTTGNSTFNHLSLGCSVMYPVLARILVFCFWRTARQKKERKHRGRRDTCAMCVFEGLLVILGYISLSVIRLHSILFHPLTSLLLAESLFAQCNIVQPCICECNFVLNYWNGIDWGPKKRFCSGLHHLMFPPLESIDPSKQGNQKKAGL